MKRASLIRFAALAAAASLALSACGGGGGGVAPSTGQGVGQPSFNAGSIPADLQIASWGQPLLQNATYEGPVSNAFLSVNVLVHQQNAQGLMNYALATQDPTSGSFHRWLTPQQIAQQFGASLSDYQKVAAYFAQQGLAVAGWPQHMILTVSGGQTSMQRAFGTTFGAYHGYGKTFIAPTSVPHFMTPLPVDAVSNLVAAETARTFLMHPPTAGEAFNLGYSPQQVQGAFDFNNAITAGYNGTGINVGIIGTGPLDFANAADTTTPGSGIIIGTGDKDLNALKSLYNIASVAQINEIMVTGNGVAAGLSYSGISQPDFPYANTFATPPPVTAPCTPTGNGNVSADCNPEDLEAQLDSQQVATLAPDATVDFYLAYNEDDCDTTFNGSPCPTSGSNAGAPYIGLIESDPEIQQAIADDTVDVVSISYGEGESQVGFTSANYPSSFYALEFAALESEGVAVFASSGDSGSAECEDPTTGALEDIQCVTYPSGDLNVTSVGGVTLPINSVDQLNGPILAWGISSNDTGYGAGTNPGGASGGGISTIVISPLWQKDDLSASMREQPDVAMIGDPNTGVTVYYDAAFPGTVSVDLGPSGPEDIGGTSVAAPEMAAMWADVLSACKTHPGQGLCANGGGSYPYRLGNAAPYLYAIYKGNDVGVSTTPLLPYANVFYDVLYGSNEVATGVPSTPVPGYPAMTGYDMITGVGVPYAGHLIDAITGLSVP
ncbi:MAG TPA: protease pro-enzyme activation domain-containing protein [Candidatus Baltobacteraceae bacterium]|nr:protease pro-enzyme activation domain-containing protein [Candidatus Baltobacteraceae bacterium]